MTSVEYSLFRAKFIAPAQRLLFEEHLSPREYMLSAIKIKPSFEIRSGQQWHIGNLKFFDENKGYFAIGRTTKSTVGKFDEITGNFLEEEQEESPYT